MKKAFWVVILLILIALAMMFLPNKASADDGLPSGVTVFEAGDHTCVAVAIDGDVELECFCPCDGCEKEVTTDKPQVTPPTEEPTKIPPTEKPKCNAGRGNGSEGDPDCDPGNSGKNNGGD